MQKLRNAWEALRSSFWFVPAVMAALAVALAFGMAKVDGAVSAKVADRLGWIYSGGAGGARGVLSTIAGSVMGVAGTTFSIVIAVLSLTSGQFGPRLLRSFMRDFGNQLVLGTFTSTFLYCLLVLRTIRGTDEQTYVPHVSVTLGVILAVVSVAVLIYFVNHVSESIQVSHLIEAVGDDIDSAVTRLFPGSPPEDEGRAATPSGHPADVRGDAIGYVQSIDYETIGAIAQASDVVVRLEVRPGDYLLPRTRLFSVWPGAQGKGDALRDTITTGRDRTTMQDAEFAFLQLSEVAVRALSPGINDPFTAIMCVDRITASMCIVCARWWTPSCLFDRRRQPRVLVRTLQPVDLVEAAFGHIRRAAKDAPAVVEKLRASLETLLQRATDEELRDALKKQQAALPVARVLARDDD